ncbi:MAG: MFS transporter, partial [Candidatus Goldbacteria bacterium]|nr:MFS transporter [Candidatus Goldiibacteriota bacterium]
MIKYFYILSGLIIYMCVGSIYSWSVFRKPLEELLKITATQSGTPYMLFLLFFSLTMPIAGRFMERLGAFKTIFIGNLFFLTGFLLSSLFENILIISLSYGIISGIGVGIIYGVPISVVSKWFVENKG